MLAISFSCRLLRTLCWLPCCFTASTTVLLLLLLLRTGVLCTGRDAALCACSSIRSCLPAVVSNILPCMLTGCRRQLPSTGPDDKPSLLLLLILLLGLQRCVLLLLP